MEILDRPDDNNKEHNTNNSVSDLPIEKQFTHFTFCEQIKTISPEEAKKLLEQLHLLYLNQCHMFTKMAKSEFSP